jgi:MFS family permease
MTEATAERVTDAAKLTPEVRNALLALIVGGIAAILDSTMVTIALHTLVVSLHSTDGTIQWVTTSYLLAMAVAIPVTGWAESRWGGKRVWMAALVLFVLGSVLCALSWNDTSLIGFRVLQGFAAGLIFPLIQTLGVRAAGGRASPNLIATVSLPLALGPILGPVIGGVILNWLSWRWLFLVNVPIIAVGLVLAWRLLPGDRPAHGAARPRLDVTGLVLLGPALAGILLGL